MTKNTIGMKLKLLNRQRNLKTKIVKEYIAVQLLTLFFSFSKKKRTELVIEECNTILIFFDTWALGDWIIISGFINELRKNNKKVYVAAPSRVMYLFKDVIPVDGVIELNKGNIRKLKNKVKNIQFDLLIDFIDRDKLSSLRIKVLTMLPYKHAIGFNQKGSIFFDTDITYNVETHVSDKMVGMLSLLNISIDNYQYILNIPNNSKKNAHQFLNESKVKNKIIIFNPFASQPERSMSPKQIYEIADFLETLSEYTTIVFDMNYSLDFSKYKKIIPNKLRSFVDSLELISQAELVISVDTSIVHASRAFNKKLISIYNNRRSKGGLSSNIVWAPNYKLAIQLTTNEFLNTELGDPMANLDTEIVIDAVKNTIL